MKIVYRYRDGVFECPYYAKRGEKLSLKQYEDEWGCRIGKAFMLGDSPKQAIESALRFLGDEPIDAESIPAPAPAGQLSDDEKTAVMARIESLYQSAMNWKGSRAGLRDIERKLAEEKAKLNG